MQTISDRINQRMNELGISQADIKRATGAGKATISGWVKGDTNPSGSYASKLASALQCSTDWLLTGESTKSDHAQPQAEHSPSWDNSQLRRAPIINWVQAGAFAEMADAHHDDWEYFVDNGFGDNVHWLHVQGDSMSPEFKEGELLLIDQDRQPKAGDYVIALENNQDRATFKKYKPNCYDETHGIEYCQLVAINPFYPPIDSRARPFKVIGVVVMHKRNLV